MSKKLIILGSGGCGKTVSNIAEQLGYTIKFLDDAIPEAPPVFLYIIHRQGNFLHSCLRE
ncbi:MAG: hypothetical protein PHW34_10495 [Hespellia sp.]|nr:hypothetical protein [Hespellia sp.]